MSREPFDVDAWFRRFAEVCEFCWDIGDKGLAPLVRQATALSRDEQAVLVLAIFEVLARLPDKAPSDPERRWWKLLNFHSLAHEAAPLSQLAARLLRRRLPLNSVQLRTMLAAAVRLEVVSLHAMQHVRGVVRYLARHWSEWQGDEGIREQLALLAENARQMSNAPENNLARNLDVMLERQPIPLSSGEAWSDQAVADIVALGAEERARWIALLWHCRDASTSQPSRKWSETATAMVRGIGTTAITSRVLTWLPLVDRPRTAPPPSTDWRAEPVADQLILSHHADVLRGLCWIAATVSDPHLARALGDLAISCYRKVPGIGPRAAKIGNAAIYALGRMPGWDSLGQLAMLEVRIKSASAAKLISSALDAAAAREGLPRDEIEELAVPSYGLTAVGVRSGELAGQRFKFALPDTTSAPPTLIWFNAKGKQVKAVPAVVRRECAEAVRELKATAKDTQKMLPAQRDRIDSLFLERESWPYATWRERYLDHPLVGTLARRLIWLFTDGTTEQSAIWRSERDDESPFGPGALADREGRTVHFDATKTTVSLWHPIAPESPPGSTRTRDDVLPWRLYLEDRRVRQPFKQAHREVYLLTDAERATETYSNRFAAHILRQHQFHALCAQRRWSNRLRLLVDADFPPASRSLAAWGLRAEYWVEGVGTDYSPEFVLDSGAFRFLATDQVRFYAIAAALNVAHAGGGGYATRELDDPESLPLRLDQIPPVVLSEVLRDVDLFVGVSGVGNNPEWSDGGPQGRFLDYWRDYSFGELSGTAQSRRAFLQRLVPRLAIASALAVTDKFLVVLGKKRTYKIHLGSSNILMAPNDQYLCIVPSSRVEAGPATGNLFLPFEGDRTLAIILSKAFLLADDDKITDRTITAQIDSWR